ncbi:META domain-containing protein [Streptomyces phyllanthi]|uniref:META domain-containing protein n=1 Tax=Streptomyces phyllanthi TaxID=1803180 RepID=A0A5N8VXE0_9ACTN|nr:META domain-containing protein [Streptomyces phyllanthi]MPY39930.1 META domain-containing protein [Streptomyces phyllanthi]
MDKQRLTLTALTLLPLVVACGSETAGSDSVGSDTGGSQLSVTGVHWTVDSLTVDGKKSEQAPDGAYLEITEDGKVNGNYGCNGFGSTATVEGDSITFGNAQSTEMACDDVPATFEESLRGTLADKELKAEVADGKLTLTSKAGDKVVLSEEKPAQLYGTKWRITSLVDKKTSQPLASDAADKAWFSIDKKDGTLSGSLGCNQITAKATVRDGQITLGTPGTTRRMCDGSLMDTERSLLELFKGEVDYKIDHRTITLTSENDKGFSAVAAK